MTSTKTPNDYMSLALTLAAQGRFTVSPNPMVGCVIVNNEQIVGQGFHRQAGGPHAEIEALAQAGQQAKDATAYVTLEPCCHIGRTPPCTNALIEAGIKKVIVATHDPNPLMSGNGIALLRKAGIAIEVGLCAAEATKLNQIFFHYMHTKRPFIIAKWAMSLDGKTITQPNDEKQISGLTAKQHTHQTRQQVDAILIGAKTAIQDDPLLTVRYTESVHKQPLRVILSRKGDLPLSLKLFDSAIAGKTLLVTTDAISPTLKHQFEQKQIEVLILSTDQAGFVDLFALLIALGERHITSLLVEGGKTVHDVFFKANLVNQIQVYLAPVIISQLKQKKNITDLQATQMATDFFFTGTMEPPHV